MTINLLRVGGALAVLYGARRFYRNWGATKEESRMRLAGDELLDRPVLQTTEAVWIDAPAATVWQWLVQIGQDRGGLYTFDTLNLAGLRYHNAERIHPEWQNLAPEDTVRLVPKGWMGLRDGIALKVVDVADRESIVLRTMSPELWDAVWSFHVIPHWDDRCRLMVRTRTRLHHPGQVLADELAGPVKAFVIRGMLLGIRSRAQQQFQAESAG
ncbi:SRPBCC family protein [Mycolicibacterium sp. ND9-15]|uniref:SRPBCC family protein n=1 Tax=Mycolicibacterium sp. ND9-15 TaxID=3042320 RepID=UPI002DDB1578|nr:SRPBCC family protein [Mycolicibacterium sp. ND9-15]WSE55161.1 SRPBCC family protein [Mycolicibacterium sp. ND9-15]